MAEETARKEVWTPLKILQWAVPYLKQKGIPNPRLDVEILISFALKIDRLKVYLQFDRPLDLDELATLRDLLKRRSLMEPLQYITGRREFYNLSFKVAPGVLIPRPETEQLVEKAVQYLAALPEEERLVLDLGTGSGCIAVSIAKSVPCRVWAVDVSGKALEIARENAQTLGAASLEFRKGSWFGALGESDPRQFKVIVSNPPYVALEEKGELSQEVRDYEPPEALFAGEKGLTAYQELAMGLKKWLLPKGAVFLELNANRCDNIVEVFKPLGWKVNLFQDLQGLPRILMLENEELIDTSLNSSV